MNPLLQHTTPFYYYDKALLERTLAAINNEISKYPNFIVHYAIKANANPEILKIISSSGLGADCVSGGEILQSVAAGFDSSKIVYAGVGKTDWEINQALDSNIYCFNVESIPELEVINELAAAKNKIARVAFRINPDVVAHTHILITTGMAENKFGIDIADTETVILKAREMKNVEFTGLHFHIGSQILLMDDYVALCQRINQLQDRLERQGIIVGDINVGGGLGIDYENPNDNPIPNFKDYFAVYANNLKLHKNQTVHFELGRAVVGQCGSLISKVTFVKEGHYKKFVILDAGMTDLIRPALYQARHVIENLSSDEPCEQYDVVGPICESSDVFAKDVWLNKTHRGDIIAIRSAGAYGESMASTYNSRKLPEGIVG